MANCTGASFVLAVENSERSKNYYVNVLGFSLSTLDLGPGWRVVEFGPAMVCLGECGDSDDWVPVGTLPYHGWFSYLVVDNLEEYYDLVVANGAEISGEPRRVDGVLQEFSLKTIDGHGIMFGRGG